MSEPSWSFPPSSAFLNHVVEVRKKGDWVPCPKCGVRATSFRSLGRLAGTLGIAAGAALLAFGLSGLIWASALGAIVLLAGLLVLVLELTERGFGHYRCNTCGFTWAWSDVKAMATARGWIECPSCGRRNPATRERCWSCDALLHPAPTTDGQTKLGAKPEGPLSQKLRAARDPDD
jgi:DNA-directed RNA polymerase subunit RPC12/RpoP